MSYVYSRGITVLTHVRIWSMVVGSFMRNSERKQMRLSTSIRPEATTLFAVCESLFITHMCVLLLYWMKWQSVHEEWAEKQMTAGWMLTTKTHTVWSVLRHGMPNNK